MKILFDGSSSFTGYWFIKELHGAGHEVVAHFQQKPEGFEGIRKERVALLQSLCTPVIGKYFGDDEFIALIKSSKWDLFCHHAADVTNYRSPDFNVIKALQGNTLNISEVLDSLKEQDCDHLLVTGSLFEQNEGSGDEPLNAFSPYGLSKGLTWEIFKYYTQAKGMSIGKFVIPNPFGPYEEPSPTFTSYLIESWLKKEVPKIKTPKYIRDNMHVSLLAKAYKEFAESLISQKGVLRINPSQYVKSQGDFGKQFADEMKIRLNVDCPIEIFDQVDFPQPRKRVNTTKLNAKELGWDEKTAWDDLAEFYISHYRK
ncbi:NAD(P)-dependent oxidoreductase [Patescibacteria group bacterium]|nr:NAD(P)-dependent oxidoreductase [Patescibacteria group bacterium]MBU1953010.1 NAD(P)-dependent oxidoreductase [Patescibacteria group bacterium]